MSMESSPHGHCSVIGLREHRGTQRDDPTANVCAVGIPYSSAQTQRKPEVLVLPVHDLLLGTWVLPALKKVRSSRMQCPSRHKACPACRKVSWSLLKAQRPFPSTVQRFFIWTRPPKTWAKPFLVLLQSCELFVLFFAFEPY